MPVPDFQSIMLPLLNTVKDGSERSMTLIKEELAIFFGLSDQDRNELLPSGKQPVFDNRVGWAKTYLKKAGLLESPKKNIIKISPSGAAVIENPPPKINLKFLSQYPSYIEFVTGGKASTNIVEKTSSKEGIVSIKSIIEKQIPDEIKTPDEALENAYQQLRASLVQDIISTLKSVSPFFFEKLVVDLLVKMGYGGSLKEAGTTTKKSGDDGIDGIIKEDKLGLDIIYIQAKRWNSPVGRPDVQSFVGALAGQGAKKGVFITTDKFTNEAKNFAPKNETKIVLIDGEQLAQYMIDYNVGVSTTNVYEIKKLDTDFFTED